jgi:UDP-glucuronate decarboxylase
MESPANLTGTVNLGNQTEFSMQELAELVLAETGSNSSIAIKPLPQDEPKQRRPDISLVQARLEWAPRMSLSEGTSSPLT